MDSSLPSLDALRELLAGVLGADPRELLEDRSFVAQGIGAGELGRFAEALRRQYGVEVPDLVRGCTSLEQLHGRLATQRPRPSGSRVYTELGFSEGIPDALYYE